MRSATIVRAIKKRSKVRIDIGPDLAQSNYRFKAQRRRHCKWRTGARATVRLAR